MVTQSVTFASLKRSRAFCYSYIRSGLKSASTAALIWVGSMTNRRIKEVAVIIVGFRNADDIVCCVSALEKITAPPSFDVFICENGGWASYEQLIASLAETKCDLLDRPPDDIARGAKQFIATQRMSFQSRRSIVRIGCASENLGYAGGINAWLRELVHIGGWKAIWILNPDTEPEVDALMELVSRAETAGKGMVGSTILEAGRDDIVRFRGGMHWQKFAARGIAIGLNEPIDAPFDLSEVEHALDSPSGASMYVTRDCIEQIGLMDESYFLFYEDLDWGIRAKKLGIGYASGSIIAHRRGTTTGSAGGLGTRSRLSVYLEHRNAIHFVRRYFPWSLPVRIVISVLQSVRFLAHRAPGNCIATLQGVFAGLKGETGQPIWYRTSS